jgi:peptidyl-prolyl cis-trans isomerase A (cyclophilin A)
MASVAAALFAVWALLGAASPGAADPVDDAVSPDGLYAVFETSLGNFACKLEPAQAPVTVGNFVGLAEGTKEFQDPRTGQMTTRRFYDGLKFHRVVPGFVVQGGDPRGDGTGGPGYEFADEIVPGLRFDAPGVLAMASAGPDRNGSQFFITLAPAPHLDGRHSVFGHVVAGMDVVLSMAKQPRTGPDRSTPVTDIEIRKLRIVRSGDAAHAFDAAAAFAQEASMRARREQTKRAALESFRAQFAQDEARAVRSPTGLRYVVLATGTGDPPRAGDTISTHCTGYLAEDGTRFWSTYDRGQPFRVAIGLGKVIQGWEEAFLQMRPGEKRRLIIPPELAYGARGNPAVGIPANATLVFDVELLAIERH